MDALTHILRVVRLSPQPFQQCELFSPWRIEHSAHNNADLYMLEKGTCWLSILDTEQIIRLAVGDLVVISNSARYFLTNQPVAIGTTEPDLAKSGTELTRLDHATDDPAGATQLCFGQFRPEIDIVYPIFSLLPPLIHIKNQDGQPIYWLATALRGITSEAQISRPGYEAVISRLMDILFIMVMRTWIVQHSPEEGGWLGALYDPHIGKSLNAIHGQPEKNWTVEALAKVSLMSRSIFAQKFTALVGEPPIKYLTRWRIQLSTTWLDQVNNFSLAQIAQRVGYTSSYAFSKAFKRLTGVSPTKYRETHHYSAH